MLNKALKDVSGVLASLFAFPISFYIDTSPHANLLLGISLQQIIYYILRLQLPLEAFCKTSFFFLEGKGGIK